LKKKRKFEKKEENQNFSFHNENYNVSDNKLNLFYAVDYKHFEKKLNLKNETRKKIKKNGFNSKLCH